jgi:MoaA/NifB/PqqE/SkfB family radical SAM enzyme
MAIKMTGKIPRLPLEGKIDLTYRCNNHCRHCWLWLSENAKEKKKNSRLTKSKTLC